MNIPLIRQRLGLNDDVFQKIPDDYILLMFTSRNQIPSRTQLELQRKYKQYDFENLEFVGDTILNYIVVKLLLDRQLISNPRDATNIKSLLTKNQNLNCLMEFKNLCRERIRGDRFYETSKPAYNLCADVFEAIIGGLYYYLYYNLKHDDALEILYDWYLATWPVNEILDTIVATGEFICPRSPYVPSSRPISRSQMSRSDEEIPLPPRQPIRYSDPIIISDDDEDDVPTFNVTLPTRSGLSQSESITISDDDDDPIINISRPIRRSQIPSRLFAHSIGDITRRSGSRSD